MTEFILEPFVGPLPLRFGMRPAIVEQILGPPASLKPSHFGNRIEERPHFEIAYSTDDGGLNEVVFTRGVTLLFRGHDLFFEPDLVATLRHYDPQPYLVVGFIIFKKLGIRLSGFLESDEPEKAIAVVRKGHWDRFTSEWVPI